MREEKRAWGVNSGRQPKQGNDPRPLVRARSPSPPSFFTMLVAALPSLVLAYNANQPLGALREPERAEVGFAEQAAAQQRLAVFWLQDRRIAGTAGGAPLADGNSGLLSPEEGADDVEPLLGFWGGELWVAHSAV